MPAGTDLAVITLRSRQELRDWLSANHGGGASVWLATFRRHHPDHLPHDAMVEELLCWGWVDSLPRALDGDRSMILISPRNPKSAWSAVNKTHVEKARKAGLMTPAGEALVATAMANGQWDFLNDVDALIDPNDLTTALANASVTDFWAAQPQSIRRGALEWIKTAKTDTTRQKRIQDVVDSARQGLRPSPFRR